MGFRKDAWATCWGVEPKTETVTQVRLSTSRKDRQTGEYVQDFSGYVSFMGTSAASKAARLKEKDRIKLGDVEVTTKYDATKHVTYTNFKCYNFEMPDEDGDGHANTNNEFDGELLPPDEDNLPF